MHAKDIERVVVAERVLHFRNEEQTNRRDDEAERQRADRAGETRRRSHRDEARDRAGDEAKQRRLALHRPFHQQPGQRGAGRGHHRVDEGQRRRAVGFQIRAGVEAKPANPQQRGADHRHGERMRRKRFLAIADALADDQRANETGDAGVDMHHRAAGEVQRADALHPGREAAGDPAHGTRRRVDLVLRQFLGFVRRRRREFRRRVDDHIRIGDGPDPMRDREVDQRHPCRDEHEHRRELHALGEGADDQGRRDHREGHLEHEISEFRNDMAGREGRRVDVRSDAPQEGLSEAANERLERSAVAKRQRIAVQRPEHADQRHDGEDLR